MFCRNCGNSLPDGTQFCPACGTPCDAASAASVNPVNPVNPVFEAPKYPMKWFKFLIYFALWFGGIANIVNGTQYLTGGQYGAYKSAFYTLHGSLQVLDIIVGVLMIALGIFQIYTRFRLAKFCANGPKFLLASYAANGILSVAYYLLVLPYEIYEQSSLIGSIVGSVVACVLLVSLNHKYFTNRRALFIH